MLRHCLAPSIRDQLNELPKSLDATYERMLDEIHSTNQGRHARRLLQCLTVAMRPLSVEELSEVLAFELDTGDGELPRHHPDWRWEDQEHAVLSACSSLITIVGDHNSRVIQFSHFSVKEYLTSERLSTASVDISQYHIALEPAHLVLTRACLGVLLNLDESGGQGMPLLRYATEQWTSHAQVGNVSSCLKDAMQTLFDPNKPHFEMWIQVHKAHFTFSQYDSVRIGTGKSPLYIAALHGFYDLVQHLVNRHPEQITHHDDTSCSPLLAALVFRKHVQVAELLVKHGAPVHIRGDPLLVHAIKFSDDGRVNAVQFLLKHGAHVNAGNETLWTPLHHAAEVGCPEVARILLEHGADVGLKNDGGQVPLHLVSSRDNDNWDEDKRLVFAQSLLAGRCADVDAQDMFGDTPLHCAAENRWPKIAQLLLDHGANAHSMNFRGCNPLHQMWLYIDEVCPQDVCRVTELLLEHGVDVDVLGRDHETPLHISSFHGLLENTWLLLDRGAKADAKNVHGQTPLHVLCRNELFSNDNANVAQLLLQHGMDVNTRDKYQATPLHYASSCGNLKITLALLGNGANVNAKNANGRTPLHQVSLSSNPGDYHHLARLLLERSTDVNARDKDQATPLHWASYVSNLETTRVLLYYDANIHAKNIHGQTPLHVASHGVQPPTREKYGPALVELLLSRGADVNVRDNSQATPFLLACLGLKPKNAEKLLQNGADIDAVTSCGQNAWHLLSRNRSYYDWNNDWKSLRELLLGNGLGICSRDLDERAPLHLACYYGQVDVAATLLEHGAEVDAAHIRGHTPLHLVTLGNHDYQSFGMRPWDQKKHPGKVHRLAERLLESGANVSALSKDHNTPLHLASLLRLHVMAQILLKHGADVNAKNTGGKSPLQLATGRKGKAMRRLLSEYSAK
jgi:ankyrin repeat protein